MRLMPANSSETTSAWKCWPSPITSTCWQAMPPSIPCFTLSGVTISMPQLVAGFQDRQTGERYGKQAHADHRQARRGRHVRNAEKAVAEAVDQVEEGVGVRQLEPESGQRMDRVEHPRQERERHDDEVLECRHLVDLLRQDAGEQAERSEQARAEQREGERPQWGMQ